MKSRANHHKSGEEIQISRKVTCARKPRADYLETTRQANNVIDATTTPFQ